jgi:hypothetical protein
MRAASRGKARDIPDIPVLGGRSRGIFPAGRDVRNDDAPSSRLPPRRPAVSRVMSVGSRPAVGRVGRRPSAKEAAGRAGRAGRRARAGTGPRTPSKNK